MKTIGENIKIRRNELGWSMQELADKMGYANKSEISRIEAGKRDITQSKVVKFAKVMGTSVGFLMGWEQSNIPDIATRLHTDTEFMSLINNLNQLSPEQLATINRLVGVLLKND